MASAQTLIDGIYYNLNANSEQATVTYGNTKYAGNVVIPETVRYSDITYTVTSIGQGAFASCSDLTSVTIPKGLTSIDMSAFSSCSNLTSVTINSNAILTQEFTSNTGVNKYFGDQVTEYIVGDDVTEIAVYAFVGCTEMKSVTIGRKVENMNFTRYSPFYSSVYNPTVTSVRINSDAIVSANYTENKSLKNCFGSQVTEYIIGDDVSLTLYNPLNREVKVDVLGEDGSEIFSKIVSGILIDDFVSEGIVNNFYASIPRAKSGKYKVKVTCDNQVTIRDGGVYTVNEDDCRPSIGECFYFNWQQCFLL